MKNIAIIISVIFFFTPNLSLGKVFLKKDQALKLAFPEADVFVKKRVFLSEDQVNTIEVLSKSSVKSKLYVFHVAKKGNSVLGYVLIDTHKLRTTTETVMFVINTDGTLKQAEILAFFEPLDYMPNDKWIDLFNESPLDDSLRIGRKIPNVTGATITSNSLTKAVRRVLAIYKVVFLPDSLIAEGER